MIGNTCVVSCNGVGYSYDSEVEAISSITFGVNRQTITGIIGPDGAGKTTLMRILAGLLTPSSGQVFVLGTPVVGMRDADKRGSHCQCANGLAASKRSANKLLRAERERIRAQIGYMPQKFGLYEELTVIENLNLYSELHGLSRREKEHRYEYLMSLTGLAPFLRRYARQLSGGMKQKLGLACCLVSEPALLLLDEPTVGVDPVSRRELWSIVSRLVEQSGTTVIVTTSYLDEAKRCDDLVLLHEGRVLHVGQMPTISEDSFIALMEGSVGAPQSSIQSSLKPIRATPLPTTEVISVDNVSRKFGSFYAVRNVSFNVKTGEIFGLLGANGAGKSTTFRMLCGLLKPTSGRLSLAGRDVASFAASARASIGYMAQKFSLYENLSVLDNLQFFSGVYGLKGKQQRLQIEWAIEEFALGSFRNRPSKDLPLGYKQRLALAAALMHKPRILFLDEPTSGVDPLARRHFWSRIKELAKDEVTILLTTHFMDEVEHCDRLVIMNTGEILAQGTPAELKMAFRDTSTANEVTMEDVFVGLLNTAKVEGYSAPINSVFR